MSLRVLDLRGTPPPFDAVLPRPDAPAPTSTRSSPRSCARCAAGATRRSSAYTAEFDGVDVSDGLRVPPEEIEKAAPTPTPTCRRALDLAYGRILAYHAHEGTPPGDLVEGGITVGHLTRPVERAGIYAPGGRARYPSTVLMCAAPARVAGVADIALCVPPASDGRVDDATLAAAAIAGITEVYRIGGAQAVAAMAYGTAEPPRVDVIAGPGNAYVAEAKRQVTGVVGRGLRLRRPLRDRRGRRPRRPAAFAAIDLVVQAEHGPDGLAWLVTWDAGLAAVISPRSTGSWRPRPGGPTSRRPWPPRGSPAWSTGRSRRLAVANTVAPEHLQLMVPEDEGLALLDLVQNAGAVFIGLWSPASMGDYIAGPNHVLPTNRTARFSSALRAGRLPQAHPRGPGDARRAAHPRPAGGHAGRDRGAAGPRRLGPPPPRRPGRRARRARSGPEAP